ncbi:hypothetical protein EVAR_22708_1 [Eumeta japonica]|uniref:Uncharacterized protein n=1 Tax=Eumeta variegata TaxID=151549 RepID=A0A4C1UTL8_EUMVA|nr:hypothetical protein EVAR_22708_1 [Eumeta japonica]
MVGMRSHCGIQAEGGYSVGVGHRCRRTPISDYALWPNTLFCGDYSVRGRNKGAARLSAVSGPLCEVAMNAPPPRDKPATAPLNLKAAPWPLRPRRWHACQLAAPLCSLAEHANRYNYCKYKARNSAAVKIVMKASQWCKIGTRGRRRKGKGALNLRFAFHHTQAIQSGRVSCVVLTVRQTRVIGPMTHSPLHHPFSSLNSFTLHQTFYSYPKSRQHTGPEAAVTTYSLVTFMLVCPS